MARRFVGDRAAAVVACAAVAGARVGAPDGFVGPFLALGLLVVIGAVVTRRPWLLAVAVAVIAAALMTRAEAGLSGLPDVHRGEVRVVAVSDSPRVGLTAKVRTDTHQFELVPGESDRESVRAAEPGDLLEVVGTVRPVDPARSRARGSHVAGRLVATRVEPGSSPGALWSVVHTIRRTVRSLAAPLPVTQRGLFEGFVLGDASTQSDLQRADFRDAGLTHLFVASGEHVAFLLLLFAPVLGRLGLRGRWVVTLVLCGLYAAVTGLQPSVLRAATMAVVATTAAGFGRPVRSWRSLAFAVTLLVLADPFLVHSVSFGLSVGACLGIVALARPLVRLLVGPLWLRRPFAVTIAAQIGAAPLLLGFPGGMPVAALPANLLAVPPAGGIMVLGLPALVGAATGLPGSAVLVWIPRMLLGWVEGVARTTAALPLGYLGGGAVLVAVLGLGVALSTGRARPAWLRRAGCTVALVALCSPVLFGGSPPVDPEGPVIVRRGTTTMVVLTGVVPTDTLLTSLSAARIGPVDAVVVPHGDDADRAMLTAIGHRHRIGRVVTPAEIDGVDTVQIVVDEGDTVDIGTARLWVLATRPVLTVRAEPG